MELLFILVGKPDGTKQAITLGFDQTSNDGEHFVQRGTSENQLQNIKYRLTGEQRRRIRRRFDSRQNWCGRLGCSLHVSSPRAI